jgi:outer membrane lipopolysaccharide assembly protein LptE/RlpB
MNFSTIKIFFYRQKFIWPVIIIALFFSACGYRFAGSGNLPGGIQTIAIDIFKNRTTETGLENTITNDLIYEFTRKGRSVQKNSTKADAILTGVIESERISTISRQSQQSALARRVEITVSLKLTGSDGGVKWSKSGVSAFEDYDVTADRQTNDISKRQAINNLSKKLAERVYNRLTEDF